MNKFIGLVASIFMATVVGNAQAIMIDETYVWNNETVIDFDNETKRAISSAGDWIAPGVLVRSSNYQSSFDDATALDQNGTWNDMGMFLHAYSGSSLAFIFTDPVKAVGGFMNYVHSYDYDFIRLTVTNYAGDVLEQPYTYINTPGELNAGSFLGIERDQADIYKFIVQGSQNGTVLDNFMFTTDTSPGNNPVPEPCTMLLMGTGLAGLAGLRKRQAKK